MKKLLIMPLALISLFACKKEDCPETTITPAGNTYTPTHQQDTLNIEYRIKTNVPAYQATYTKFSGFNSDGSPILLSITDSLHGNDTIRFESITSPFGKKYHYQIFTMAPSADSNTVYIYINGNEMAYRPNYGSVFNFTEINY